MSIIRINLNLTYFFDDHRQLTRIVIDDLKTIKDLQKHITRTFDIKKFYLMCDNYYLPPCSDIRVLSDNDIVLVVPSKKASRNKNSCETLNSKADVLPVVEIPEPIHIVEEKKQISPRKSAIKILEIRTIKAGEKCSLTRCDQNNSTVENGIKPLNGTENKHVKKSRNRSAVGTSTEMPPAAMDIAETTALPEESRKQTEEMPAAKREKLNRQQANGNNELGNSVVYDCAIETLKSDNNISTPDTNESPIRRSKGSKRSETLKCSGVGDIINLLNKTSDDLQDSSNAEDAGIEYVTKRRRYRVRSRKRKRMDNCGGGFDTSQSETSVFRPPKTVANPLSHIVFEDDEAPNDVQNLGDSTTKEGRDYNRIAKKFAHSTPYNKHLIDMRKCPDTESPSSCNGNARRSQEPPRNKTDVSKATLVSLSKVSPTVGSMVMFKVRMRLKLANDYTPQISEYILAEVTQLAAVGNQLTLKILEGHGEFEEPRGKFSCTTENGEEQDETAVAPLVEHVCLDKNALVDAKLVIF